MQLRITRRVCVPPPCRKHNLLEIGHRFHPGNFKEKADFPPNANASSECARTFLSKEPMRGRASTHSTFTLIRDVPFLWARMTQSTACAEAGIYRSPCCVCLLSRKEQKQPQGTKQPGYSPGPILGWHWSQVRSKWCDVNCCWATRP